MQPLKPLVVLGQGLWQEMACALLSTQLHPYGWQVIAVTPIADNPDPENPAGTSSGMMDNDPTSLVCDPEIEFWCQRMQWPLSQLLSAGQGQVSLGHRYQTATHQWFVPYGHYGLQSDADEFSQALLAFLAAEGAGLCADDFSIAAQAALQQKFALAPANRPDLVQALSYGLQLESRPLTQWLRQQNQQAGVVYIQSKHIQRQCDANGAVLALQLDKQLLELSFCVDCRRPPVHADSPVWLSARVPTVSITPCASALKTEWGWLVQHQLANCSTWHTSCAPTEYPLAVAKQWLVQQTGVNEWQSVATSSPTEMAQPWHHNWLQCGAAAASLDHPLFSGLMALQFLLLQWLELLPSQPDNPATAALYNQHWQQYQSEVRGYLQCHQNPLATPQGRLFQRLGRLLPTETTAIQPAQWFGLMYGLGIRPELPSMLLAQRSEVVMSTAFWQIRQSISKLINGMPFYAASLLRQQDANRGL